MQDLWDALIADYKIHGRTHDMKKLVTKWATTETDEDGKITVKEYGRIGKFFRHLRADQVTTDLLKDYIIEQQKAGLENATINRDMSAIRRALSLAYHNTPRKIAAMPVFPKRLEEAPPREGFVNQADFDRLAKHAPGLWMRGLLATAYAFGFRRSELLGMRVRQLDLLDRTIRLNRGTTKNKKPRLLEMTDEVYRLLAECVNGKKPDDLVFTREGRPIVDMRDAWAAMTKAAGLEKLLFHDLRRSAIRNMVRRGISEKVAMEISGHTTRSVFERYNIVSEDDLLDATRKIQAGEKAAQEPLAESPAPFGYSTVKVSYPAAPSASVN